MRQAANIFSCPPCPPSSDRSASIGRIVRRASRAFLMIGALIPLLGGPAAADDSTFPHLQSLGGQFTRVIPAEPVPTNPVIALDGTLTTLSRYDGQVVVINFWATWCPACQYELPSLERLAGDFRQTDLAVVGISIDEAGFTSVLPFLSRHQVKTLDVLLDPEQSLGSRFLGSERRGALPLYGLPMTYFVNRRGNVLGYISGAVEWDSEEARNFLNFLLSADPDRSLGCGNNGPPCAGSGSFGAGSERTSSRQSSPRPATRRPSDGGPFP